MHLDLYVSRGGFLVFFCLFSVVYTRGLLLCARVIVGVKRVRERLCGHVPPKKTTLSLSRAYRWVAQQKFAAFVVRISSSPFSKRSSRRGVMSALLLSKRFEKLLRNTHNFFRPPHVACEKFFPKEGLLRVLLQSSPRFGCRRYLLLAIWKDTRTQKERKTGAESQ